MKLQKLRLLSQHDCQRDENGMLNVSIAQSARMYNWFWSTFHGCGFTVWWKKFSNPPNEFVRRGAMPCTSMWVYIAPVYWPHISRPTLHCISYNIDYTARVCTMSSREQSRQKFLRRYFVRNGTALQRIMDSAPPQCPRYPHETGTIWKSARVESTGNSCGQKF